MNIYRFKVVKILIITGMLLGNTFASVTNGTINANEKTARLMNPTSGAINAEVINFSLEGTTPITITDTAITGTAWGSEIGYINLGPFSDPTVGVKNNTTSNSGLGILSGYAWSMEGGWIKFGDFHSGINASADPTAAGVVININGQFVGNAWSTVKGWIRFDCSQPASCVTTDWRPVSGRPSSGGTIILSNLFTNNGVGKDIEQIMSTYNRESGKKFFFPFEDQSIVKKLQKQYGEKVINDEIYKNTCLTKEGKKYYRTCQLGTQLNDFDEFRENAVCENFIVRRKNKSAYEYEKYAPRKEVTNIAVKMKKVLGKEVSLVGPESYTNIYLDIGKSSLPEDTWIQPIVETALHYNLLSLDRVMFEPDKTVRRAEAYALIMKSVCMISTSPATNWEEEVWSKAFEEGITTRNKEEFEPQRPVQRQELFTIASRSADWAERTGGCDPKPKYCFIK